MAGHIALEAPEEKPLWDRFTVEFEDGTRFALRDRRRLGRAILNPDFDHIGPDAAGIGRAEFRERFSRSGAPLKARLLDQGVMSGVGNLLADEILWRARMSPLRPANDLSADELDALRRSIRAALRDATAKGGAHTGHLNPHRVRGGRCPRCGTELQRARGRRPDDVLVPVDQA